MAHTNIEGVDRKARAAYDDVDPGAGYPAIKNAILKKFDTTPEGSRVKLRELKYDPQQDPGDMLVTQETHARCWILPTDEELQKEKKELKSIIKETT